MRACDVHGLDCSCPHICTRSDALAGGASYPVITVTVNVDSSAAGSVTNSASVSGGGDSSGPHTATDPTAIKQKLTVNITGTGTGTVTANVGLPISCATAAQPCSDSFTSGKTVLLTATPDAGSRFVGWTGACVASPCSVVMNQARSVTATFAPKQPDLVVFKSHDGVFTQGGTGVYTITVKLVDSPTVRRTFQFEFHAVDRQGADSGPSLHYLTVQ